MNKKTKIVCTLGPATIETKTIVKLIKAGMNVARLNFSHGDYAEQLTLIKNIRAAAAQTGATIAIMQDLQGPKIRLGILPDNGVSINKNEKFILDTSASKFHLGKSPGKSDVKIIPVQYKHLHKDVSHGDIILIEDGLISLEVVQVNGTRIEVRSINKALLKTHKGINVPTASISANPLTPKDIRDLHFGLKNNVDFVALSFVRHADDIKKLRTLIKRAGSSALIVAKIERHEALQNLEAIIKETDAVMVARGDLGVETPAEEVPVAQKRMVKLANNYAKPVIVATEMLQSMIENPRATRAEVSDVANAVFDHTDAVMLSNETAVGKFPVEAVKTMTRIALNVEKFQNEHQLCKIFQNGLNLPDNLKICHNASLLALESKAKLIVAITQSGYTANALARQRIFTEIVAITPSPMVKRQLQLTWGFNDVFVSKLTNLNAIKKLLIKNKKLKKGDKVVLVYNVSSENRSISLQII
jgi:pyruvate kinase